MSTKLQKQREKYYLQELLEREFPDYNPIYAMCELAQDELVDPEIRFKCHKEIASYLYPKLKSVETVVHKVEHEGRKTLSQVLQERQQRCIEAQYKEITNATD